MDSRYGANWAARLRTLSPSNPATAVDWIRPFLAEHLQVFKEDYEQKIAPIKDDLLYLAAIKRVRDLECPRGLSAIWRKRILDLLDLADDRSCFDSMRAFTADLLDKEMPSHIREYVCDYLSHVELAMREWPARRRGNPGFLPKRDRNEIVSIAGSLLQAAGFKPTKNKERSYRSKAPPESEASVITRGAEESGRRNKRRSGQRDTAASQAAEKAPIICTGLFGPNRPV